MLRHAHAMMDDEWLDRVQYRGAILVADSWTCCRNWWLANGNEEIAMTPKTANAWQICEFPRKPFGALRLASPKFRQWIGALPKTGIQQREIQVPALAANEVLLDVEAVSLNFRDYAVALGMYSPSQSLPLTPCSDATCTVIETGKDVTLWRPGDRIITHFARDWLDGAGSAVLKSRTLGSPLSGVLQTQVVMGELGLVRAPESLTNVEASTLTIAGLTAWSALTRVTKAERGEVLLVQGSGGVSLYGILLGKELGLKVIVTTSSATKAERLRALGADQVVVTPHGEDWSAKVREANGDGVDIVLDFGGGSTLGSSIKAARHGGRIACIGFLGGIAPRIPVGLLMVNGITVHGVITGSRAELEELVSFIESRDIHPAIDEVFPFSDARAAFSKLASGRQFGNICISEIK